MPAYHLRVVRSGATRCNHESLRTDMYVHLHAKVLKLTYMLLWSLIVCFWPTTWALSQCDVELLDTLEQCSSRGPSPGSVDIELH